MIAGRGPTALEVVAASAGNEAGVRRLLLNVPPVSGNNALRVAATAARFLPLATAAAPALADKPSAVGVACAVRRCRCDCFSFPADGAGASGCCGRCGHGAMYHTRTAAAPVAPMVPQSTALPAPTGRNALSPATPPKAGIRAAATATTSCGRDAAASLEREAMALWAEAERGGCEGAAGAERRCGLLRAAFERLVAALDALSACQPGQQPPWGSPPPTSPRLLRWMQDLVTRCDEAKAAADSAAAETAAARPAPVAGHPQPPPLASCAACGEATWGWFCHDCGAPRAHFPRPRD